MNNNNTVFVHSLAAEEEVRAPLPVRTERLVGPTPTYHQRPLVPPPQLSNPFRNFGGEADDNGGAVCLYVDVGVLGLLCCLHSRACCVYSH